MINYYREEYGPGDDDRVVEYETSQILNSVPDEFSGEEHLKRIFSFIDLTTLNPEDNESTARRFTGQLNQFATHFRGIPQVAALCVYPALVDEIKRTLTTKEVKLASVGAGFPSSQTFLSVKLAECELLVKKGVDEIDIVLPVGKFLAGETEMILNELILIRETARNCCLKIILETGLLKTAQNIRLASLMAMESGADFIKTSTGKIPVSATPEAVYTMARAIRDFYSRTGRSVGIKAAGGIVEVNDAIVYYTLVDRILGEEWLNPALFRIGASRLANNLLSELLHQQVRYF